MFEDPDLWRGFRSDAHHPVSFKLAPPEKRQIMQEIMNKTLATVLAEAIEIHNDDAVSLVAQDPPKPALPPPLHPWLPAGKTLGRPTGEMQPAKCRSAGMPSPPQSVGASGSSTQQQPPRPQID